MEKFIHIGANKAASTTLQRHLFSKSKDLNYLGEDCIDYDKNKYVINSLISDDDFHFSLKSAKEIFYKKIKNCDEKTFIFSSEDIMTSRVPSQCAERLYKIIPDSSILIIIRNQIDAIASWYANHGSYLKNVPRRYWRRYVSFDDWMEYNLEFNKYSPLESFLYHKQLSLYKDLFGKNKINILFFEDFIHSKNIFMKQLCSILNIETKVANKLINNKHERQRNTIRQHTYHKYKSIYFHNTSVSSMVPYSKSLLRIWNNYLTRGEKYIVNINNKWKNVLINYYSDDNKKLKQDYKLDIDKYKYPTKNK